MEREQPPISDRERTIEERETAGWTLVGEESLFRDKFQTKKGRFLSEQIQTEEDIKANYRNKFKAQARDRGQEIDFEIDFVPIPLKGFQGIPIDDPYKGFYVFAKKKE